jgi:hypothetical protein
MNYHNRFYQCSNIDCDCYMDFWDYEESLTKGCPECGEEVATQWLCRKCGEFVEEKNFSYLCNNCREDEYVDDSIKEFKINNYGK